MNHDLLIDAAARRWTDADPAPEFRARVMASLDRLDRANRASYWRWLVAPAAAAVGIATWAMLLTPRLALPSLPDRTLLTAVVPAALPAAPPLDAVAAQPSDSLRPAGPSADELAWLARAVPPLPPSPPLAIDPIQPTWLSIPPITVEPLVLDPIAVPPVSSTSGERN